MSRYSASASAWRPLRYSPIISSAVEPLPPRMLSREGVERGDDVCMSIELDQGGGVVLGRRQSKLLQPESLRGDEGLVVEIHERLAAYKPERRFEGGRGLDRPPIRELAPTLCGEAGEPPDVDVVGVERQAVSVLLADEHALAEHPP